MLSPELKKLKEQLKGNEVEIDEIALLEELERLDKGNLQMLYESLAGPSNKCPTCGRNF